MPKPELEIYLISGLDHRKAAQEAGASGFFSKKLTDRDTLKNWMKAQKGRRVVLIEDNRDSLETQKELFIRRGAAEIYTFTDPQEALERIPEIDPDVVLSDVNMPGMNGIELVKRLRGSE